MLQPLDEDLWDVFNDQFHIMNKNIYSWNFIFLIYHFN